jgi:hypothetical protein
MFAFESLNGSDRPRQRCQGGAMLAVDYKSFEIEQILCVNFLNLTTHIRISLRSYELLRRIAYPDRSI